MGKILLAILAVIPVTCLAFMEIDLTAPAYTDAWGIGLGCWIVSVVFHPINCLALARR